MTENQAAQIVQALYASVRARLPRRWQIDLDSDHMGVGVCAYIDDVLQAIAEEQLRLDDTTAALLLPLIDYVAVHGTEADRARVEQSAPIITLANTPVMAA